MKLLSRLRGLISSSAPTDDTPSSERSGSRRRRGRRGGRGRGRGGAPDSGGSAGGATAQRGADTQRQDSRERERGTSTNATERTPRAQTGRGGQGDRRGSGNRRRADRPQARGRPARSASLDAPLPEDVAFRPTSEGGDGSILPGRRRPPPGARTTNRVLVTGKRILPVLTDSDHDDPVSPPTHDGPHDDQPPADPPKREASAERVPSEEGEPSSGQRRRRGRRGGRGRGGGRSENPEQNSENSAAPSEAEARSTAAPPAPNASLDIDPADFPEAFRALGISDHSLSAVTRMGFSEPMPIQERAIPALLDGRDVVGIAQTGTGKTIAFGIPMVDRVDPLRGVVQGLVLVPTRELAQQVLAVLEDLARPFGMRAIGLLGGHSLEGDFRALEAGPQIVVGTPGRIKDHLRRGTLSLRDVRLAILDEADQMLDIGFLPDITHILGRTPRSRQTALFSATMPHTVMRLVRRYMEQPETIAVASDLETVKSIEHIYFEVAQRDKVKGLRELIERELRGRTLVFSRTKRGVDRLADLLQGLGVRVGALHGDLDQRRRDRIVRSFRGGELDILIATNVAARGIDIPEITHVVNYDVPDNAEEYVHRTGRTGRAGRDGKAISFVSEVDVDRFDVLRETFGELLKQERLELYV